MFKANRDSIWEEQQNNIKVLKLAAVESGELTCKN